MSEQGALSFLRLTPHTTPISRGHVQRHNVLTAGTHGLLWMHPKMGSTLESRGRVRVAGSPLMSPFARAKPKVLKSLIPVPRVYMIRNVHTVTVIMGKPLSIPAFHRKSDGRSPQGPNPPGLINVSDSPSGNLGQDPRTCVRE